MSSLELKVPPPVVTLACGAAMALVAYLLPFASLTLPGRRSLALVFVVAGLASGLAGVLAFRRQRTTLDPHAPELTSSLVSNGIYRLTRNPMYLGLLLILVGWGVHLSNLLVLPGLPLFIAYLNRFQIGPEERILAARFGPAFDHYRRSVRRWL